MSDATIKLMFSGVIALGGMISVLAITITGMCMEWAVAEIIAIDAVPSTVVTTAIAFFYGDRNGFKNGQKAAK